MSLVLETMRQVRLVVIYTARFIMYEPFVSQLLSLHSRCKSLLNTIKEVTIGLLCPLRS